MTVSNEDAWRLGYVLQDMRKLFVLWAVKVRFCTNKGEFRRHFGADLPVDELLLDLEEQKFVEEGTDFGDITLTQLGEAAVSCLDDLTPSPYSRMPEAVGAAHSPSDTLYDSWIQTDWEGKQDWEQVEDDWDSENAWGSERPWSDIEPAEPGARSLGLGPTVDVVIHEYGGVLERIGSWKAGFLRPFRDLSKHDPAWLSVFRSALRHVPYCLEGKASGETVGLLPLCFIRSHLFGRFLVSLPFLDSSGVIAADDAASNALIDRAVELADELNVRFLELRHTHAHTHPALSHRCDKVQMRLTLPSTSDILWSHVRAKVRNQVRKAERSALSVDWGGENLLREFYAVFSRNMRDLGTPVYTRALFQSILSHFSDSAEFCVMRRERTAIAAALVLHGRTVTYLLNAAALRHYNPWCPNMFMYWQLLQRAIQRNKRVFDFGRSTRESATYRFKSQWGAAPQPLVWQYYVREGTYALTTPESSRYDLVIAMWKKLPVAVTRLIGPAIIRGIPS